MWFYQTDVVVSEETDVVVSEETDVVVSEETDVVVLKITLTWQTQHGAYIL